MVIVATVLITAVQPALANDDCFPNLVPRQSVSAEFYFDGVWLDANISIPGHFDNSDAPTPPPPPPGASQAVYFGPTKTTDDPASRFAYATKAQAHALLQDNRVFIGIGWVTDGNYTADLTAPSRQLVLERKLFRLDRADNIPSFTIIWVARGKNDPHPGTSDPPGSRTRTTSRVSNGWAISASSTEVDFSVDSQKVFANYREFTNNPGSISSNTGSPDRISRGSVYTTEPSFGTGTLGRNVAQLTKGHVQIVRAGAHDISLAYTPDPTKSTNLQIGEKHFFIDPHSRRDDLHVVSGGGGTYFTEAFTTFGTSPADSDKSLNSRFP
ncbi:MAG: hypothetical protein AAF333_08825 [Planctomycetota bacterium]